jgi:peptidoglycan/xylan/chitin deacetylase (PgdA/CDA1 family)
MIKTLHFLIFISCIFYHSRVMSQQFSIADWKDNKKAAVNITFDDGCGQQFSSAGNPAAWGAWNTRGAWGMLDSLKIKGTFYVITDIASSCNGFDWRTVASQVDLAGHEIGGHTIHHPHLSTLDSLTLEKELKGSRDTINKYLTRQKCQTMAYPYGDGGIYRPGLTNAADSAQNKKEAFVRRITRKYYISGRAAGVGPENYDTYQTAVSNPYFPEFDYQVESMPIYDTTKITEFTSAIDNAMNNSGWFIPFYHLFNQTDPDRLTITTAGFRQQMLSINTRRNNLWIAPYVETVKYFQEKRAASLVIKTNDFNSVVLGLTDTLLNAVYYDSLTIVVKNCTWINSIQSVKQSNRNIPFIMHGTTLQFNAVPDAGDITILKSTATLAAKNYKASQALSSVNIYPNPSGGASAVSYKLIESSDINLTLYNASGMMIKGIVNETQNAGDYTMPISVEGLQPGIYFCRFSCDGYSEVKKLIVSGN